MSNVKVLTAKQMAEIIGCEKALVTNVLATFKIEHTHQVDQTKFYPEWTINAVKAECQRRQATHKAATVRKWLDTTGGRLANALKKGQGCFLNQKQVKELLALAEVRALVTSTAARLRYEEDNETTKV